MLFNYIVPIIIIIVSNIVYLIANVSLAILLIIIGVLFYKEHIGLYQIVGIICCIVGLIFVNLN